MLSTRSGSNTCLFCNSRRFFQSQFEISYRRDYNSSPTSYQHLTTASTRTGGKPSHRRARSKGQTVPEGYEQILLNSISSKARLFKQSRARQWAGTPFKEDGRIYGSRDIDFKAHGSLRQRKQVAETIQGAGRKILKQWSSRLEDPVFKLEIGYTGDDFTGQFWRFQQSILHLLESNAVTAEATKRKSDLTGAYGLRGENGLELQLKFMLQADLAYQGFGEKDILHQAHTADFRYPAEWYSQARKRKRTIHLHIGPTNSGKTYHALKRLEEAKTGCYAGPLRLLAHEIYTRLNAKGKNCDLVTGDEIVISETAGSSLSSCTVEMAPLGKDLDVAVIDEIQMMGDRDRGWAWTQALLGFRARELHLCGETRTLPLIREIAASLGEELVVHNYERLNTLKVASTSLEGRLEGLKKGDCVISFSRKGIHGLKKEIHSRTGKDVAIVYGGLPPEIRAQQAKLFNDPDNTYDILVASDAIGMGLNLSIKRIIFETTEKFNGVSTVPMEIPSIKQIGGRAGRYKSAAEAIATDQTSAQTDQTSPPIKTTPSENPSDNIGYVTSLHDMDLPRLQEAMNQEAPAMTAAGIKAPEYVVTRFASFFPHGTPLSFILLRLEEISRINPRYFLCSLQGQVQIADTIQSVQGLTIYERMLFCYSPADSRDPKMKTVLVALARCVANRGGGALLDIPDLGLEILDTPLPETWQMESHIAALAMAYKTVVLYLWLSYRLSSVFPSQALAFHTKALLQEKLDEALSQSTTDKGWLEERYKRMFKAKERDRVKKEAQAIADGGNTSLAVHQDGQGDKHELARGEKVGLVPGGLSSFIPPATRSFEERVV